MHKDLALCWQVEQACALAWPALHIQNFGGYSFRHTINNRSRRANSINPISANQLAPAIIGSAAEKFFAHNDMRPTFRLPEIAPQMSDWLDAHQYGNAESETITLFAPELETRHVDPEVMITPQASEQWLDAYTRFQNEGLKERETFANMLAQVFMPCLFGSIARQGKIVSIAYAVQVNELVIIEAVGTAIDFRRQGLSQQVLQTLLATAAEQGCTKAALQVVAENSGARNLYAKLGFSTELYRYHYRTK